MKEENMENDRKIGENRAVAFIILALGFLIAGILSLMLGFISAAIGVFVGALIFLLLSLFHLTREYRQMKDRAKSTISE
jgi:xanthine/uracil permease